MSDWSQWLAVWGAAQATAIVFRPILEDLARDVAKDAAKSYVGRCFQKVFSVIHKQPLTKATGLAVKELLELVENELIRAGIEEEELRDWTGDVRRFIEHGHVRQAIASLFMDPDYHLDPATFASAWQQLSGAHALPDGFSWEFIAKRFAGKVAQIRQSSRKLQQTFESLAGAGDSAALRELAGLPPGFDLETYREALVERYGHLDFASLDTSGAYYSNVRLWSVFVPQSVRECHRYDPQLLEVPKEHLERLAEAGELDAEQLAESRKLHEERRQAYFNEPRRPVLEVTDDPSLQRLVVLGDPGSGKSSLLRFLALRWAGIDDPNLRYTQPLPLLIELRDYNRWQCTSGRSFPKYLHEASTWHRLNQQTLQHLLEQPDRVVLLLDGLDEVFDPAEREQVVNDIHRFSNEYRNVRIVVTSRVVGYQPHRLRNADFRHFMLQDLDDDQIDRFLDRWHEVTFDRPEDGESKRERLARAIEQSKSITQLAGNPLLLTMMAILNRHQELPRDRADLYQQCARLLLHQWDVERKLLDEFPGLSAEIGLREKTDILRRIAAHMQSSPGGLPGNIIDGNALTGLIEDYLHDELRFDQARAVSRALVRQLRERNFILCFLGANSYAFVHRTFLEYFCAADIVHRFRARMLSEDGLIALFDEHCRDDEWHEVLRLICGQIDEQFVGRIVKHLATRTDLEEWDGETALPELPMAIWCLSEVRSRGKIEEAGAKLLLTGVRCFLEGREPPQSFVLDLVAAAGAVGKGWPGKSAFQFSGQHPTGAEYFHHWHWPHFLAAVFERRCWIEHLAICESSAVRCGAIETVAERWADRNARKLLDQRAMQDEDGISRATALRALAQNWPDQSTRELLEQHAVHDEDYETRRAALRTLCEKWPDQNTRELLQERAVQDEVVFPRRAALRGLVENWPDQNTRDLVEERAVHDEDGFPRSVALWALAEIWPDDSTREILHQRALQDEDYEPRRTALQALAEIWPDENTRELLQQRVANDENAYVRGAVFVAIAENWPDQETREMLEQRAVKDEDSDARRFAIRALATTWADENTRELLAQRAREDTEEQARGSAFVVLGQMHSKFGGLLPTLYLDGMSPYLDPLEPIPRQHIERAAERAGIPPEDIDAEVASLSDHLGWDIIRGAKKS